MIQNVYDSMDVISWRRHRKYRRSVSYFEVIYFLGFDRPSLDDNGLDCTQFELMFNIVVTI